MENKIVHQDLRLRGDQMPAKFTKEKNYMFFMLLLLSLTLSACSVTGKAAEVDNTIVPFTDHKSCVKMCQDNFCEVSIEGQASCLQQGFDSCQKSCDLRFQK